MACLVSSEEFVQLSSSLRIHVVIYIQATTPTRDEQSNVALLGRTHTTWGGSKTGVKFMDRNIG